VRLTGAGGRAGGRAAGRGVAALASAAVAEQAGSPRPGPARGGMPLPWALPVAVAGGLALAAAFPPVGAWPLAVAGPAMLTVALWGRSLRASFVVGLVFGAAFFLPLIYWLVNVAWYVWAALAIAEMGAFAVLTVGQRLLLRLRAWPVAVAGWWVAAEAVRDRWPYAFPWGRLAMSQAGAPTARWASIGGVPLLTFLLALAGACLAWLLLGSVHRTERPMTPWRPERLSASRRPERPSASRGPDALWASRGPERLSASRGPDGLSASRHPERPSALRRCALPALAFAGAAALALAGRLVPVDQGISGGPTATVAAIQGDVPHARNLPDLWRATTVTRYHTEATDELAARVRAGSRAAPDVVIWPENSTDLDASLYPVTYTTIQSAVDAVDRPVLVGAVLQNPLRNAGQLWLPRRGPVAVYVKRQLVPFGEYIPFRSVLSHLTSLTALQPTDFTPGHKAVVFGIGKVRLGDVICYEVGFDGLVRSEVTAGANLLAVQSNDADFELDGQLGESEQQVAMARIRAIESDRAVVYASTTGESAIISPDGSLIARSGTWRRAELDARVALRTKLTLADRLGGWPEGAISAATAAALAWVLAGAALAGRRSRRDRLPPAR